MKKKAIMLSCMLALPQIVTVPFVGAESTSMKYSPGIVAEGKMAIEPASTMPTQSNSQTPIINAKISKDKAIEIARSFITIPKDYTQQSVNYQSNWYPGNRTVWNINWNKQTEQHYGNIMITVDAENGSVISMNRWDDTYNQQTSYPPKYNWESAKKIANQFLQQKAPQKANLVKLDETYQAVQKPPLQGNASYMYPFMRVENGIPFTDQQISITVNGDGEITGYEDRWNNDIKIPTSEGMISQRDAEKKIKDTLPVQLKYQTIYNQKLAANNHKSIKLAFDRSFTYPYIDAKTGQWLDYNGKTMDGKAFNNKLEPLSTEKPIESTPIKKEISQEEAIEIVKKHLTIPAEAKLENVNYNDANEYQPYPIWDFTWVLRQNEAWIHVSLNCKTGQILNYSKDDPKRYRPTGENETIKQVINYDQALEKAKEALKTFAPDVLNQLTFDPLRNPKPDHPEQAREFNFTFYRLVNGIVADEQTITLSISTETGEVFQFYQNWDYQVDFPDATNAISLEKGKEIFLDNFIIEPRYAYIDKVEYSPLAKQQTSKPEVKLVYQLVMKPQDQGVYLDAVKGKWVSMESGEPIREKIVAKDIKGHPAEKALQLLIDYNAIDVDDAGLVKPDEEITRGEMVKMLMLVSNPDPYYYKMNFAAAEKKATFNDVAKSSPYFAYVESAVQQGLIDKTQGEFKPNEPVSREELAEMIVKAMRLEELAKVSSLFNVNFTDADKLNKKGEAAIVHHLGIMPATNNMFEPNKKVTRGAGAQAFYQFLQVRGKFNK